jgi:hypothetical protein
VHKRIRHLSGRDRSTLTADDLVVQRDSRFVHGSVTLRSTGTAVRTIGHDVGLISSDHWVCTLGYPFHAE